MKKGRRRRTTELDQGYVRRGTGRSRALANELDRISNEAAGGLLTK